MSVSARYLPAKPQSESALFIADFSNLIANGVGITSATLAITTNTNPPQSQSSWTIGTITHAGKRAWALLGGGSDGTDFLLTWTIVDTAGNTWTRAIACLCAETS